MVAIRRQYQEFGYNGLCRQQGRKRYIYRVPWQTAEQVLSLYQRQDSHLSVRRFHQKLHTEYRNRVSYFWLKQALGGAGLLPPAAGRRALSRVA